MLDALGVLERIKDICWQSNYRTYKNDKDETTRKSLIANEELCGYKNHRLYRRVLLEQMKAMLAERQVPIIYNARFQGITSDTLSGVEFQINGQKEQTAILFGTDGIFSTVRKHLDPDIAPEYTGTLGVLAHIHRDTVQWPYPDYEKACTIQGKPGAFFMIPEVKDGSEIMVGMQVKYPDQSRVEWESMAADRDKMASFFRNGYDQWHDTAKSIIDSVCANKETLYLWPFLRMPKLRSWYSSTGRVILVGDAAHAIPPSSGQGVNQALEDIYALAQLVRKTRPESWLRTLGFWQDLRQARIDAVFDWTSNSTNVRRMPEAERRKLVEEGKIKDPDAAEDVDDMRWLYLSDSEQKIEQWLREQNE